MCVCPVYTHVCTCMHTCMYMVHTPCVHAVCTTAIIAYRVPVLLTCMHMYVHTCMCMQYL